MSESLLFFHQKLPEAFADRLRGLHGYRKPTDELRGVIAALVAKGWTKQAVGDALGISRERARQLALNAPALPRLPFELPEPPTKPVPFKRVIPTLTEVEAEELRDLYRRGQASGQMSPDHPAVVASSELSARIQDYLDRGYRLIHLARALGVSKMAIIFRLGRHGYRHLAPSQRCNPGPIASRRAREVPDVP